MADIRLQRLANVLVDYACDVKPGMWVGILGDVNTLPALRAVYAEVLRYGGNPSVFISDETMARQFAREATDDQIAWLDPSMSLYYEKADIYIRVGSSNNTRAMTNVDAKRVQKIAAARKSWLDTRLTRSAKLDFEWVGTWYPTEASAQEANLSLEEYENFIYGSMFLDHEDPAGEWRKLSAEQQFKVDWLKGKKDVKLQGPNADITLSIEGRTFINSDGHKNMPSGEIFTGPVEDSVNGWIRFDYPSIVAGRAVSGIELKFENGKVVNAKAETNDDLLQAQLNTDAGARYLGEFAIGTNFGINRFTGNILFDEKIGGTIHMAIGMGYPETGSHNRSAVHWDMICDMRNNSTIHVDGELFYQNGQFVV
ncbi:MAG: aminopeptidase [Anaerolineae bacterium]|nr:aminopeptidase [Anaerolineae bacterium]